MDDRKTLPSVSVLLSNACMLCTFVYLMTLSTHRPTLYYPLMLLPYSLLLYVADRIFLRRERTVLSLVLLNGGLCLAAFLSTLLLGGTIDWANAFFAGVFCLWLAVRSGQLCWKPPILLELTLSADLCLVVLALFTAFLSVTKLSVYWCIPIAAGCAVSILGLIVFRSGSRPGARSWVFLFVVFAGVFALVWLLVSFVAAPAGEGLVTIWNMLISAVRFLLGLLWRLLLFLASLLPERQPGESSSWSVSDIQLPSQAEEPVQENPLVQAFVSLVLAATAVVLLFLFLRHLHHLRLPAARAQGGRTASRRSRVSLLSGLRRLLIAVGRRLRLQIWLWRHKNTAQGLYFLLVQRSAPTPWHKLRSETPREFLSRLRKQSAGDDELIQALDILIPAVDRALFAADGAEMELPQAQLIRRRLGAAIRQGIARDVSSRVRRELQNLRRNASANPPG